MAVSLGTDVQTPTRTRLECAFERFIDARLKTDDEIATLIRDFEADIAVDLMGYTGECRSWILARRPAPIQVNYLGFPGTMGADHTDYIIADETVIPIESQGHYTEKIAYLPDCFLPVDRERRIAERPSSLREAGLPETGFIFASFNNTYKFSPQMFDVWMRLLHAIPGSVLWLPKSHPAAVRNLLREAELRGVAPGRLVFAPVVLAPGDHLARLRLADVFLDTLPYNAHTTAVDALWAGLPVLTLRGKSFAGRVASSLLQTLGLPELIADSLDAYEAKALALARDPNALAAIKNTLAARRKDSPLFDTERFTRHLESALVTMWERHERGEPPASFTAGRVP
jgi:predicted O-linked N-acetylglucosamine transferase (SPINDLY family)